MKMQNHFTFKLILLFKGMVILYRDPSSGEGVRNQWYESVSTSLGIFTYGIGKREKHPWIIYVYFLNQRFPPKPDTEEKDNLLMQEKYKHSKQYNHIRSS